MRKFKLIKEYPGSPKLETIVERDSNCSNYYYRLINGVSNIFTPRNIENHPEFWEEVVEKDYEILSLISNSKNNEVLKNTIIDATKKYNKSEPNDFWDIHSVKRLSDGEIFTIGDKINDECYNHSLDKITLYDNKILLQHNFNTWTLCHSLKNVIKSKVPLFTTEDGVDIFKGDLVVCFNKDSFCIGNKTYLFKESDKNNKDYLFFSTKEKAEEYILLNKPVLSIQEIITLKNGKSTGRISPLYLQKLKELAKQKLNNKN